LPGLVIDDFGDAKPANHQVRATFVDPQNFLDP
jgi:hypothetical protein